MSCRICRAAVLEIGLPARRLLRAVSPIRALNWGFEPGQLVIASITLCGAIEG